LLAASTVPPISARAVSEKKVGSSPVALASLYFFCA